MFPAWAIFAAFVLGTIFGASMLALAIWLGTPRGVSNDHSEPEETLPRHRPIATASFGPENPLRTPSPPLAAHQKHRPISSG